MNNTNNNIFTQQEDLELEAIFKKRDDELKRQREAMIEAKRKQKELADAQKFREIERAVTEQIKRNEPPKIVSSANDVMPKSLAKTPIACRLANAVTIAKNNSKAIIASALLAALLITPAMNELKINLQVKEMTKNISSSLQQSNIATVTNLSNLVTLTESPREFIEQLNISKNDHTRLFILSLSIEPNDFENILKELGYYGGFQSYLKHLNYEHNEYQSAKEQYCEYYTHKLESIIKEINKNPDLAESYFKSYPELQFIFNSQNIYITENEITSLNNETGRGM